MSGKKSISRRNLVSGAAALAASTAIVPGVAQAQPRAEGPLYRTKLLKMFNNSDYTSCDAETLAKIWVDTEPGVKSLEDVKVFAGRMIFGKKGGEVRRKLLNLGQQRLDQNDYCDINKIDNPVYSYADYESLAQIWDYRDNERGTAVDKAKLNVYNMVITGENFKVKRMLSW